MTGRPADGSVVWKHHLGNFGGKRPPVPSDFSSLWPLLEAFTGPVLVVRGEGGFLTDSAVAELRSRIPDTLKIERVESSWWGGWGSNPRLAVIFAVGRVRHMSVRAGPRMGETTV
jgi:hypothetical protein